MQRVMLFDALLCLNHILMGYGRATSHWCVEFYSQNIYCYIITLTMEIYNCDSDETSFLKHGTKTTRLTVGKPPAWLFGNHPTDFWETARLTVGKLPDWQFGNHPTDCWETTRLTVGEPPTDSWETTRLTVFETTRLTDGKTPDWLLGNRPTDWGEFGLS